MAEETGQERTEQATQKRREETRRRGQVARSMEVNSAVILITSFLVLFAFGPRFIDGFRDLMGVFFRLDPATPVTVTSIHDLLIGLMWRYLNIMLPLFAALMVMGVLINILQVGFLFTGEPLQPKLEKINPVAGLKRLFSKRSAETLIKDILKIIVVGWIGYSAVKGILGDILNMSGSTAAEVVAFAASNVFRIAMKIFIGYVILAILDYAFQRWDYEQSMKMTRQEIREELKQTEGDPLLRARVRSVQREMARRRMMEEVPKADVVVTNPTEIAVALRYEPGMPAPQVVAKGRRLIAERIRNAALEHDIPIVRNVPLAQALYKAVNVGQYIPGDLYTAVAEVLAYVYKLKGKNVG